jgi:hypothetical protein
VLLDSLVQAARVYRGIAGAIKGSVEGGGAVGQGGAQFALGCIVEPDVLLVKRGAWEVKGQVMGGSMRSAMMHEGTREKIEHSPRPRRMLAIHHCFVRSAARRCRLKEGSAALFPEHWTLCFTKKNRLRFDHTNWRRP